MLRLQPPFVLRWDYISSVPAPTAASAATQSLQMSETSYPQRLVRLWSESARPGEMLESLRKALGAQWLERHACELRRFAVFCARQRASHQGSSLLELADWYAHGDFTAAEVEPTRAANVSLANAASTRGLTNPSTRAASAAFLAAFHALGPDAFDAAVQSQRVVERFGAAEESDATAIRREQAEQLRALFGNPFAGGASEESSRFRGDDYATPLFAWQDTGRWNPPCAEAVRQLIANRETLLELDAWTPVPQGSCTFGFGDDSLALPIGALVRLWDAWPAATGSCPRCGGTVRAWSIGGTAKRGGILGVCVVCERELVRPVGGVNAIADLLRPVLAGTPFHLSYVADHGEPMRGRANALAELVGRATIERMLRERVR